ncbi:DUF1102 domain-containing protein [Halorubrum sp. Hd13]|uniref:DUF1102 domain-containing protein n=1 Tax=Halorubrum sp. Hd13 TaxID=1480728 RepID=UPI000B98E887|nr:DUF1102 domain-containing protein [Halorubrum sp. Hd13]OYR45036.1 hypothetical protein DJ81_05550 [Halorubrum sp. Hd13]
MANRRKFIAGLGALATGSAAAVGTGAFETSASERTVNVNVAADSAGFVDITALNDTYASGTDDGQLELNFNSDSGLGIFAGDAQGLNPDTTFNFSEVFQIANVGGTGSPRVIIEATGFSDLESLELTVATESGSSGAGHQADKGDSLRAKDYENPVNLPVLNEPGDITVDIEIETKSADDFTGTIDGELTIHYAAGGSRNELTDVLGSGS